MLWYWDLNGDNYALATANYYIPPPRIDRDRTYRGFFQDHWWVKGKWCLRTPAVQWPRPRFLGVLAQILGLTTLAPSTKCRHRQRRLQFRDRTRNRNRFTP